MALLPNNLYHWYIREGSISNTISQLHIDSIFYGYNYIRKFFQDRNIYSKENKGLIDKLFYKQLFDIYIYNNGEKVKPYIENIVDEIEKTFHNYDFVRFCILDKIKMKRMRSDLNLLKEKNNALEGEVKKIKEEKEACELSINKLKRSKWYRISKWLSKNPIYRGIRRVLSL
jgi:FtsZ-binding cell division protein ZapB